MITRQDFMLLLEDVLDEVGQNLRDRRAGVEGTGTSAELEQIHQELADLAGSLNKYAMMPRDQRYLRAAYIVTDTWPPKEKLGERICMVDYLYRHDLE